MTAERTVSTHHPAVDGSAATLPVAALLDTVRTLPAVIFVERVASLETTADTLAPTA